MISALIATRSRWPLAARAVALGALAASAAIALLVTSGYLISRAAQQPEILTLGVAIVGVRFFGISRSLLRYLERLVSHDVAFRSLTDLRVRFFERLVPLVPAGLPGISTADLLSRFVSDADRMQDLYLRAVMPPLIALVVGLAAAVAAFLILPVGALVMVAVLVLGGVVAPAAVRAAARRAGVRQAAARADAMSEVSTLVTAGPEIALAGRERDWEERVAAAGARLAAVMRRDAVASGMAVGLAETIAAGAAVVIAAVAIPAVGDGQLDGVMLAALVLLALASAEIFTPLGPAATAIDAVGAAAHRLDEITGRPNPLPEPVTPLAPPRSGSLSLRSVGFSYAEGPGILSGADLEIRRGEAVALVGPSGCGKSTVADLLTRLRDPDEGRVELGGIDLREIGSDELRKVVRLAPQDAHLFTTTIRANLLLAAPDASEAMLMQALHAAGLGTWIEELERGIDTHVGEAGAQVSGGQRQRLAGARLLACDSDFLIFDEPTTHLDAESAALMIDSVIARTRAGCGVLVITHDRSLLSAFDRVLELRRGSISSVATT